MAGLAAPWRLGVCAEALQLRLGGSGLVVSAPRLRLLRGKPLDRLHNGASVIFAFQLSALGDRPVSGAPSPRVLERVLDRFAISFDLWEEKFSVSRLSRPPRSVSHLTSAAAESWCLENLPLPTASLAPDRAFWIRLEVRADDPKDRSPLLEEPGISLARLIELFSGPSRSGQASWLVDDGPFRLGDLTGAKGRG